MAHQIVPKYSRYGVTRATEKKLWRQEHDVKRHASR